MTTYVLTAGQYADRFVVGVVRADNYADADEYADVLAAHRANDRDVPRDEVTVEVQEIPCDLVDLTAAAARVRAYLDSVHAPGAIISAATNTIACRWDDVAALVGLDPTSLAAPVKVGDEMTGAAARSLPRGAAVVVLDDPQAAGEFLPYMTIRGVDGWVDHDTFCTDAPAPFELSPTARVRVAFLPGGES